MPEREPLTDKSCDEAVAIAVRWGVDPRIMIRLVIAATLFTRETGRTVNIISGYRTEAEQRELEKAGRPAAAPELSTHLSCPATGVDISVGFGVTNVMKAIWGRLVIEQGLRWGGGSPVDRSTGIPSDWNHVDAGPRASSAPPPPPPPTSAGGLGIAASPCPPGYTYVRGRGCLKQK